ERPAGRWTGAVSLASGGSPAAHRHAFAPSSGRVGTRSPDFGSKNFRSLALQANSYDSPGVTARWMVWGRLTIILVSGARSRSDPYRSRSEPRSSTRVTRYQNVTRGSLVAYAARGSRFSGRNPTRALPFSKKF